MWWNRDSSATKKVEKMCNVIMLFIVCSRKTIQKLKFYSSTMQRAQHRATECCMYSKCDGRIALARKLQFKWTSTPFLHVFMLCIRCYAARMYVIAMLFNQFIPLELDLVGRFSIFALPRSLAASSFSVA